ncbi:MAG TPA: DUF4386 domain-containing protein [Anaerolineaceae bacterium]|nr:DUF4386 domain-containing protein [Anaerolineaceae bacterium]
MNPTRPVSRILGFAFLFQFLTSFGNGVFLKPVLIMTESVPETISRIAQNPGLMRTHIFVDMLTALGVIFLGAALYFYLRKQNEILALTAFGFYILEGAVIAASKMEAFSLLSISQEYAVAGQPATLLAMAGEAMKSLDFAGSLLMLAFCPGGILFYYLLNQSGLVPRWLSLWGLIAVLPVTVATVLSLFGVQFPIFLAVPYIPFEFVIGVWILWKGILEPQPVFDQASALA